MRPARVPRIWRWLTALFQIVTVAGMVTLPVPAGTTEPSLEKYMAVLGIPLGCSTLSDARRQFGGTVVHNGQDAAGSKMNLCYRGEDGTVLLFGCWECGGSKSDAMEANLRGDEFWLATSLARIELGGAPDFNPSCTTTRRVSRATAVGSLRVGMARSAVVRVLGKPARETDGELAYEDGARRLTVRFENDRVVSIYAARWWE